MENILYIAAKYVKHDLYLYGKEINTMFKICLGYPQWGKNKKKTKNAVTYDYCSSYIEGRAYVIDCLNTEGIKLE